MRAKCPVGCETPHLPVATAGEAVPASVLCHAAMGGCSSKKAETRDRDLSAVDPTGAWFPSAEAPAAEQAASRATSATSKAAKSSPPKKSDKKSSKSGVTLTVASQPNGTAGGAATPPSPEKQFIKAKSSGRMDLMAMIQANAEAAIDQKK